MAKKLYVGNLPFTVNDEELKKLFSEAGTVESASVIIDRMSGHSKGFGFVEMATDEEMQSAIQTMNGKEVEGRAMTVNEARPLEDRPKFSGGFKGGNRDRGRGGYGNYKSRDRYDN